MAKYARDLRDVAGEHPALPRRRRLRQAPALDDEGPGRGPGAAPDGVHLTRPLVWLNQLPTVALLPPATRQTFGFPWGARHERALRLSARGIRRLLALTASVLRHWPSARAALRRSRTDGHVA